MILSFLSLENRLITIIYWDQSHVTRLVINMTFLLYWCRASAIAMTAIQETRLRKRCSPSSWVLPHYPYLLWKARTKENQATSWTEVIQTGSKDRQNRNCCVMPALDGSRASLVSCGYYEASRKLCFLFLSFYSGGLPITLHVSITLNLHRSNKITNNNGEKNDDWVWLGLYWHNWVFVERSGLTLDRIFPWVGLRILCPISQLISCLGQLTACQI